MVVSPVVVVPVVGSVVEVDNSPAASSVASVAQKDMVVDTAIASDSIPYQIRVPKGLFYSLRMGSLGFRIPVVYLKEQQQKVVAVGFLVIVKKEGDAISVAILSHVLDLDA